MNPWFDYGFGQAPTVLPSNIFAQGGIYQATPYAPQTPAFSPLTPLQPAPVTPYYGRQPFMPATLAGFGFGPYSMYPFANPVQMPGAQALPGAWQFSPASSEVISQLATLQPATLGRPIGFQPPIGSAASLPQFQQGLTPQFQQGLTRLPTDEEIEDLISEVLDSDPLLAGNTEIEVRCESGVVRLTGNVQHKWLKRTIGDIAWSVPGIVDVQNNLEVASRRRIRAGLRKEASAQQRK